MPRLVIMLLLLTSFTGYLEWGHDKHAFILQVEASLFRESSSDISSIAHPLIFFPLAGQLMLLVSLFQSPPKRSFVFGGIVGIGLLMVFLFIIGLLSANPRITAAALPFIISSLVAVKYLRVKRQ